MIASHLDQLSPATLAAALRRAHDTALAATVGRYDPRLGRQDYAVTCSGTCGRRPRRDHIASISSDGALWCDCAAHGPICKHVALALEHAGGQLPPPGTGPILRF